MPPTDSSSTQLVARRFAHLGPIMLRIAAVLLAFSAVISAQAQQAQPPTVTPAKPAVKKSAPPKGAAASRPTSPPTSGPCVGVISALGERFGVKKIGITVFGNEYGEIPADDWGLDQLVVERVRAIVGPALATVRVAHARGALDSFQGGGLFLFKNVDEKSVALVRQIVGPVRCERYVVVTRATAPHSGNQSVVGVGIVNTGVAALSATFVHAVVRITVHDGRTFAALKNEVGSTGNPNPLMDPRQRRLSDFKWPETPAAADSPVVRGAARALLAEIMDNSLPALLAP